jgi:hypothetical protein
MTPLHDKTVALIDPLWCGHHPMYFNQFSASFLRSGARVIGLCPEPEAAMASLERSADTALAAELAGNAYFHRIEIGKRSFFNGRFEGDPARTFHRWKHAADALADAEANSGMRADLVYFPYLDSYLRFLPIPFMPALLLGRPWSGLYLRNHHHGEPPSLLKKLRIFAKGDALIRSRLCRGIGVLDERYIQSLENLTGKTVTAYPDVTQGGLPPDPFTLALEIRRKAAGRTIIGMIGLERRKGFVAIVRTAVLARRRNLPYYFVCAGAIDIDDFPANEQAEIAACTRGIASGEIDNLHFDPTAPRIPCEEDFNSLFSHFDIAWAAYENFQGSSGTLSKAALFEIPCIATAGECIGHRVETYRIGLTIPEATPENALAAIPHLIEGTDWSRKAMDPRYAGYREQHSQSRLDGILQNLLSSL